MAFDDVSSLGSSLRSLGAEKKVELCTHQLILQERMEITYIYIFIDVKYTHKFFLVLFEVMSLVEAALKVGGETLRFLHFSKEGTMVFGKKNREDKKRGRKASWGVVFLFFFKWNMYTRREVKKKS